MPHLLPPEVVIPQTPLSPATPPFRHMPRPAIVLRVPGHVSQDAEQGGCGSTSLQSLSHYLPYPPRPPHCTGALGHLLPHLQSLVHLSPSHTHTHTHHNHTFTHSTCTHGIQAHNFPNCSPPGHFWWLQQIAVHQHTLSEHRTVWYSSIQYNTIQS